MHTEEQAKNLWCPMVRMGPEVPANWNNCIANSCAMWRRSNLAGRQKILYCADHSAKTEPPRPATVPASWVFLPRNKESARWVEPMIGQLARIPGYCGLAGRPEDTWPTQ